MLATLDLFLNFSILVCAHTLPNENRSDATVLRRISCSFPGQSVIDRSELIFGGRRAPAVASLILNHNMEGIVNKQKGMIF